MAFNFMDAESRGYDVGINHAMVWLWCVRVVSVSRTLRVCARGGVRVRVCLGF